MNKLPLCAILMLCACATPGDRQNLVPLKANPSGIIAAELAFNRLAQDKGQWTSFRETSTKDAEMFVPERVKAIDWLKNKADPPQSVTWQPRAVWTSCDGSAGITHGGWQGAKGAQGYFTTVWQRQLNGTYKWILDHGDEVSTQMTNDEMIAAKVASCKGSAPAPLMAPPEGADMKVGLSKDQTLSWTSTVNADKSRTVTIRMWNGTGFDTVQNESVAAPNAK